MPSANASPRHLVLNHARRLVAAKQQSQSSSTDIESEGYKFPALDPGQVQIYSFFEPRLQAGVYTILATQDISATVGSTTDSIPQIQNTQTFEVVSPLYHIPNNVVCSTYPPQGYGAQVETLPHVVLKDPHLPWEWSASKNDSSTKTRVPWLALLSFTGDELLLDPNNLAGKSGSIFGKIPTASAVTLPLKQSPTFAVSLPLSAMQSIAENNVTTPIDSTDDNTEDQTKAMDVIFLKPALFNELFKEYDSTGIATPTDKQKFCDVSRYKYLSHVRLINTQGMAEASSQGESTGLYSIVVGHRTGPLTNPQPVPVYVHLVSIQGVDQLQYPVPDSGSSSYVALASLYSWSYSCLPADSFNIYTAMRNLGDTMQILRAPDGLLASMEDPTAPTAASPIAERLRDGYTLCRYRVQTGEVTTAITRGALSPTVVPRENSPTYHIQSNSGTSFQVFDRNTGLMDITYSAAWQLGKTLALADQAFCSALSRLRSTVEKIALDKAKADELVKYKAYLTREGAIASLMSLIERLKKLSQPPAKGTSPGNPLSMVDRFKSTSPKEDAVDLSLNNPSIRQSFVKHAGSVVAKLSGSFDDIDSQVYNELNTAYSTDWMAVLSWVLDRMFLSNIPAQYLIVDPSYLPPESLRFFHIDANWIDALLDGALSIGNQLSEDVDLIRIFIKTAINQYLINDIKDLGRPPQIPSFGFFMRSDIVSQFPDLKVTAKFEKSDDNMVDILRHANIDNGVMLCLFDRSPVDVSRGCLKSLKFTQPPHQQSFAGATTLDENSITISYRKMYSTYEADEPLGELQPPATWNKTPPTDPPVFVWGQSNEIRTLIPRSLAENVYQALVKDMKSPDGTELFTETQPTAAMMGVHLNSSTYILNVGYGVVPTTSYDISGDASTTIQDRTLMTFKVPTSEPTKGSSNTSGPAVSPNSNTPVVPTPSPESRGAPANQTIPPPPNFRPVIPMKSKDQKSLENSLKNFQRMHFPDAGQTISQPPAYLFDVYTVADLTTNKDKIKAGKLISAVPMNTGLYHDLVFRITLATKNLQADYNIKEFRVIIRQGDVSDSSSGNYLIKGYGGPGPVMLDNLRFNVLSEYTTGGDMVLRVVPRSNDPDGVPFKRVANATFILGLVNINSYEADKICTVSFRVKIWSSEGDTWYGTDLPISMNMPPAAVKSK
ncbi:hypothetical protein ABW20_dc0104794 [Dactylellina cionopaga]|nr:hypothetical protein ABW20_dc0104794 [Dactylellina cionopaga]